MWTKHIFVFLCIRNKGEVGTMYHENSLSLPVKNTDRSMTVPPLWIFFVIYVSLSCMWCFLVFLSLFHVVSWVRNGNKFIKSLSLPSSLLRKTLYYFYSRQSQDWLLYTMLVWQHIYNRVYQRQYRMDIYSMNSKESWKSILFLFNRRGSQICCCCFIIYSFSIYVGVCVTSSLCNFSICVLSSFAITLLRKRERWVL